jgi:tellurite resistance protein TehA-like permease
MVAGQASQPGLPDRLEANSPDASEVFGQYGAAVSGASAVLLLFAILTIERLTGSEIRLQILYLVPVAVMTWSVGRAWGFALAVVAVGATFATYHANHVYPGDLLYYCEAGVTLATLSLFVLMISRLRSVLEATTRRLRELQELRPGS